MVNEKYFYKSDAFQIFFISIPFLFLFFFKNGFICANSFIKFNFMKNLFNWWKMLLNLFRTYLLIFSNFSWSIFFLLFSQKNSSLFLHSKSLLFVKHVFQYFKRSSISIPASFSSLPKECFYSWEIRCAVWILSWNKGRKWFFDFYDKFKFQNLSLLIRNKIEKKGLDKEGKSRKRRNTFEREKNDRRKDKWRKTEKILKDDKKTKNHS